MIKKCIICYIIEKNDLDNDVLVRRYLKGIRGVSGEIALVNFFNAQILEKIIVCESKRKGQDLFIPITNIPKLYESLIRYEFGKHVSNEEAKDIQNLEELTGLDIETFMKRFVSRYYLMNHIHHCLKIWREPMVQTEKEFYSKEMDRALSSIDKIMARLFDRLISRELIEKGEYETTIIFTCKRCARKYSERELFTSGHKCVCERYKGGYVKR